MFNLSPDQLNSLLEEKQVFAIGTTKETTPRWLAEVMSDARLRADKLNRQIDISMLYGGQWHHFDTANPSKHLR